MNGHLLFVTALVATSAVLISCGEDDDDGDDGDGNDGDELAPGTSALGLGCGGYCRTVMTSCTGASQPYSSEEGCVATCGEIPTGDPAQPSWGTLSGYMLIARRAARDPRFCVLAGPPGADVRPGLRRSGTAGVSRSSPTTLLLPGS